MAMRVKTGSSVHIGTLFLFASGTRASQTVVRGNSCTLQRFLSQRVETPGICVFGHKIPDTDAICSAIARAKELQMDGLEATAYRLGDLNAETEYVLSRIGIKAPPLLPDLSAAACQMVAIVDTNNPEELPDDINQANITSIIDHHKLAGLTTPFPIEMDVRPLCSTGSIIYHRLLTKGYPIQPDMATLMLACILSDSLNFRSVTTTPLDEAAARQLATIADVDVHEFGESMLEAKSKTSHMSPKELVMLDSKVYKIHGRKTRISVVETVHSPSVLSRSSEILCTTDEIKKDEKLDDIFFFVVDVAAEQAVLLSKHQADASAISDAFSKAGAKATVSESNGEYHVILPGILSRKKQIIPTLEA